MEDIKSQGVLVYINVTIPQGAQLEDNMHIQGQEPSQVCILSDIKGGDMCWISFNGSSKYQSMII